MTGGDSWNKVDQADILDELVREQMTDTVLAAVAALREFPWDTAAELAATPELRRIAKAAAELVQAVDNA